jgi:hypothetical protein
MLVAVHNRVGEHRRVDRPAAVRPDRLSFAKASLTAAPTAQRLHCGLCEFFLLGLWFCCYFPLCLPSPPLHRTSAPASPSPCAASAARGINTAIWFAQAREYSPQRLRTFTTPDDIALSAHGLRPLPAQHRPRDELTMKKPGATIPSSRRFVGDLRMVSRRLLHLEMIYVIAAGFLDKGGISGTFSLDNPHLRATRREALVNRGSLGP